MPATQDLESLSLGTICEEPIWDISDTEEYYSIRNHRLRVTNISRIARVGFLSLKNDLRFFFFKDV